MSKYLVDGIDVFVVYPICPQLRYSFSSKLEHVQSPSSSSMVAEISLASSPGFLFFVFSRKNDTCLASETILRIVSYYASLPGS